MKRIFGLLMIVFWSAFRPSVVSAYNVGGLTGAWAFEDDTNSAAVVAIEPHVAWLHCGGEWVPCGMAESNPDLDRPGVVLNLSAESRRLEYVIEKVDQELESNLPGKSPGVAQGSVVWGSRTTSGEYRNVRALKKVASPDWDRVRKTEDFTGAWMTDEESGSVLVVRPNRTAALMPMKGDSADKDGFERSREMDWRRDGAGIRFFTRETDPRVTAGEPLYRLMTLKSDGRSAELVGFSDRPLAIARATVKIEDPVERRRTMAKENDYHGMWALKDRTDGYSFYISAKGRGLLVGARIGYRNILPFSWAAGKNGLVRCALDPEFAMDAACWFSGFDFRYLPETNVIELILPPNEKSGEKGLQHKRLDFFNWNERVDETTQMIRKDRAAGNSEN